jgi:uncharacterized protein
METKKSNKFFPLWLGLIMILIFIIQTIFPEVTELFLMNKKAYLEPWRFVSAIFLHGSVSHLVYNLFALILFGLITEKVIGSKKFIILFFSCGIIANIVSMFFYDSSLGASGAIMGVIGVLTILKPMMGVFVFGMIVPMFIAAIIWVVGDLLGIFMPSNVGHIAHLSGIFTGIIVGIFIKLKSNDKKKKNIIEVPEHILRRWEALYMERL